MSARFTSLRQVVVFILVFGCALIYAPAAWSQRRRAPAFGARTAIIVDERLAALRVEPNLTAELVRRLGRGRQVSIVDSVRVSEGIAYYRVAVTRRTRGWIPALSLVLPSRAGEGERLLKLIRASEDFDQLARARIFLDWFPRSALRPEVLLLFGNAAHAAAEKLSRDAARRFDESESGGSNAPIGLYFLNFSGLDRYRKQGIVFTFDRVAKQFHYDGAAWREIVRRYPRTPEAAPARQRLDSLAIAASR
ncbi:MAG: hypothetical protein M3Q76_04215 [Acidobacteriota bacterium]|nr:hypothetical protein [Acidobacteriota bacterium]